MTCHGGGGVVGEHQEKVTTHMLLKRFLLPNMLNVGSVRLAVTNRVSRLRNVRKCALQTANRVA